MVALSIVMFWNLKALGWNMASICLRKAKDGVLAITCDIQCALIYNIKNKLEESPIVI